MDEAEHLADRVGVVVAGRLVATGTPAEIGRTVDAVAVVAFRLPLGVEVSDLPDLTDLTDAADRTGSGTPLVAEGRDWQLQTSQPTAALHRLTSWARQRQVELPSLTVTRPSLEDAYLRLVAREDAARPAGAVREQVRR